MKTKKEAIIAAQSRVSLNQQGNQWRVDTYNTLTNTQTQGIASNWETAKALHSQSLIDEAREALGKGFVVYSGGRWTNYL